MKSSPSKFVRHLPTDLAEMELIRGVKRGDFACFEELYTRHKTRVFTLCLRMTGNYAEAEKCAQEAFLRAYRKLNQFRVYSTFSTWLYRLTVNTVLMQLRKRSKGEISLEAAEDASTEMPLRQGTRDTRLEGSIDRIALEAAIAQLSPGYRTAFVLHDVEGFQHNEIAEMLGWSVGTSKSQLSKARLKLRQLLCAYRDSRDETNRLVA